MTFPYKFEDNFERGVTTTTLGGMWGTEIDTESKLDVVSYKQMAEAGDKVGLPWNGVYAAQVDLSIARATQAYLQNSTGFATATGSTAHWLRIMMYVSDDLKMENLTRLTFFSMNDSGGAPQLQLGIHYNRFLDEGQGTGRDYRIWCSTPGIGESHSPGQGLLAPLPLGQWFCIEVKVIPDVAGAGSVDFIVNGKVEGWRKNLTFAAIDHARVGVMNILYTFAPNDPGGTTAGKMYFDNIAYATPGRIGCPRERFPLEIPVTKSGHIVLGPGVVRGVKLLAGTGTDAQLKLYDTDEGENYVTNQKDVITAGTAGQVAWSDISFNVTRGIYAELSGAGNPRAIVYMSEYYMNDRENDATKDAFDYYYGAPENFAQLYGNDGSSAA